MLAFRDSEGKVFRARSYIGIVRTMRQAAWVVPGKQQYMRDVAKRIAILDGGKSDIHTMSAKQFVESLVRYGWLTPVPSERV